VERKKEKVIGPNTRRTSTKPEMKEGKKSQEGREK
jgi:hypothetical protein